jgi:hypothetical protein
VSLDPVRAVASPGARASRNLGVALHVWEEISKSSPSRSGRGKCFVSFSSPECNVAFVFSNRVCSATVDSRCGKDVVAQRGSLLCVLVRLRYPIWQV